MNFGQCRLAFAYPESSNYRSINELEGKTIATSYPNIVKQFLKEKSLNINVTQFSGHEVDDIVLAMETGLLIRSLWLSTIMTTVFPRYRWVVPILKDGIARAAKLIARAKYDESLREKVLMRGSSSLVGKGFVLPLLLKTMLKSFVR